MESIQLLNKIIPKEIETLIRRYRLLQSIQSLQPVGRRILAGKLSLGEKVIRTDTDFFTNEGFVDRTSAGMVITKQGVKLLKELKPLMRDVEGLHHLEEQVTRMLCCEHVLVVSGDTDLEDEALTNIGRAAADELLKRIDQQSIIAITGGHTVRRVVEFVKPGTADYSSNMVVPARGSLGNNIETQANTLVEILAKKLNSSYKLLNLPDNLSVKAIESVTEDPNIKKVIQEIRKATLIVFGIGNAQKMAYRRDLNEHVVNILTEKKAVAEALGYYFNKEGDMIYDSKTIGFRLEEFYNDIHPIAVAGGASKADAILAVRKLIRKGSLVIDEACAKEVVRIGKEMGL